MVYEFSNDFSVSSSVGFNINNSSNSDSKAPTWNIPTTTPSAPPYPGSEAEFNAVKEGNNGKSYNFFFIDGQAPNAKVVEQQPEWKTNPLYEKQATKRDLIEGALGIGTVLLIFCIGLFVATRSHKRAVQQSKRMFKDM